MNQQVAVGYPRDPEEQKTDHDERMLRLAGFDPKDFKQKQMDSPMRKREPINVS